MKKDSLLILDKLITRRVTGAHVYNKLWLGTLPQYMSTVTTAGKVDIVDTVRASMRPHMTNIRMHVATTYGSQQEEYRSTQLSTSRVWHTYNEYCTGHAETLITAD